MPITIESVVRKAKLLEKKCSIRRKEASVALRESLDALEAGASEVLDFLVSASVKQASKQRSIWESSFRSNSVAVLDREWTEQPVIVEELSRLVNALPNGIVYVFGNDWRRQGAVVVSIDFITAHIEDFCSILENSFIILDAAMENALRFEADEVGGRYSVAEAYAVGGEWEKCTRVFSTEGENGRVAR